jgi:hypothetical protein
MRYIEDYILILGSGAIALGRFDITISTSLAIQCLENKPLTEKQSVIALRLLRKYRDQYCKLGHEKIIEMLNFPVFKHPFRIVDNEKSISIDYENKRFLLKFPFNQELVTEIRTFSNKSAPLCKAVWDPDNKKWALDLNEISLGFIIQSLIPKGFVIGDEIKEFIRSYEDIQQNLEKYIPMLVKADDTYILVNSKLEKSYQNVFDAVVDCTKMGIYVYDEVCAQELEPLLNAMPLARSLTSKDKNKFFVHNEKYTKLEMLHLLKEINSTTAIFLDEMSTSLELESWVNTLYELGVPNEQIAVYFRRKNDSYGVEFNQTVKKLELDKKAEDQNVRWMFLSSKYPKSLIKNKNVADVCLFIDRYATTHHSVINVAKNAMLIFNYNKHSITGDDIVKL